MWATATEMLRSSALWSAIAYLLVGAVVGAVISVSYSLRARRPKLVISGCGGGGNQTRRSWRITVSNRPTFLGKTLDGESARDVGAHIRLADAKSQSYATFWGHQREHRTTIAPGDHRSLELFHWEKATDGYFIVDNSGEPVARFQDRELEFVVTLEDRLQRSTTFKFNVEFDDTHLKNGPRLQIRHPITWQTRIHMARRGLRILAAAFRSRS
jgi:hypothetical protein